MSEEIKPTPISKDKFVIKKSYLIGAVALIATIFIFFIWQPFGADKPVDDKKATVKYNRDEPGKPQILQGDYEGKVRDMLEQGMTVNEISKETGLRRDVVRKIKKEMDKAKDE